MKYFAQILIRPNTETHERFIDENKSFSRFKGLFIKKDVKVIEETFSAPDILAKLDEAFNSIGISNLVRVTHDDSDFYLDKEQKTNDLDVVIQEFGDILRNSFERFFEEITVIMEAKEAEIDYLIELILMRVHPIGEYPVKINFSGIPEKYGITDIEEKIKLFVAKVELSIHKYIDLSDITVSIIKKEDYATSTINNQTTDNEQDVRIFKGKKKCSFFPLYGVMLGETSIEELAKKGTIAKDFGSDKKRYKYYTIKDMRFWHNDKMANLMYLTCTSPLPNQWCNCGFDWGLSYNEWKSLMEKLGFVVSIVKKPVKEWYNGKRTLSAEFDAVKKINSRITISFKLDFNYSQKSSVDSKSTLYSMTVTTT
jgi:hypothetical protein